MGNRRLYKIERFHTLGTSESERLKATALPSPERLPSARLLEAGLRAGRSKSLGSVSLSFDKPLPGKPPTRPPLPFSKKPIFHIATQSLKGGVKGHLPVKIGQDSFNFVQRTQRCCRLDPSPWRCDCQGESPFLAKRTRLPCLEVPGRAQKVL